MFTEMMMSTGGGGTEHKHVYYYLESHTYNLKKNDLILLNWQNNEPTPTNGTWEQIYKSPYNGQVLAPPYQYYTTIYRVTSDTLTVTWGSSSVASMAITQEEIT